MHGTAKKLSEKKKKTSQKKSQKKMEDMQRFN